MADASVIKTVQTSEMRLDANMISLWSHSVARKFHMYMNVLNGIRKTMFCRYLGPLVSVKKTVEHKDTHVLRYVNFELSKLYS